MERKRRISLQRGLKCRGPSADAGGERRENVRRRDDTPPDNKTAAIRPVVLRPSHQRDSSLAVAGGRDLGVRGVAHQGPLVQQQEDALELMFNECALPEMSGVSCRRSRSNPYRHGVLTENRVDATFAGDRFRREGLWLSTGGTRTCNFEPKEFWSDLRILWMKSEFIARACSNSCMTSNLRDIESNSNAHETLNRYVANHLILVHAERAILKSL